MAYGTIKVDTITFTDSGVDKSVSISGLVQNPTFSGNITVTGTVSGNTIQGQTVSGVTVTGTTANFTSGNFTTFTGGTITLTSGVIASGTAANPSLSILGDANTGLYSPGADQLAISTGGSPRVTVTSTGVAIGTTSASYSLHVVSASDYQGYFKNSTSNTGALIGGISGAGIVTSDSSGTPLVFGIGGTERGRFDASGRLLVGTSTAYDANTTLQVKAYASSPGPLAGVLDLQSNYDSTIGDQGIGWIRFLDSNGAYRARIACVADGTSSSSSDAPGRLEFSTTADGASSPTERMRITNAGAHC